jgi:membrane-associated HD superfamily phosphohydrolase
MDRNLLSYGLQYACYLIEAGLVFYLARSRQQRKQGSVVFYLCSLLAADVTRACVLHAYGLTSRRYFYVYWSTDFLLVVSAFLLVCFLFRRACREEEKMWRFARLLLLFVFILVVGISGLIFSHHYSSLFPYFVFEFNQNLYFSCLVLNTLLYLLLQQIESADDQLGLLVCGVGIQFAGPAATLALVHLTTAGPFAQALNSFSMPVCTLGMLLVWAYAIVHVKGKATAVTRRKLPVFAQVAADLNV